MPTIIFILLPDKGRLQREQLRESRLPLLLDQQHYHKNYIYGSLTPSINCKSNDCGSLMPYIICKTAHRINNADHGTPIPSSASSGGAQTTTPATTCNAYNKRNLLNYCTRSGASQTSPSTSPGNDDGNLLNHCTRSSALQTSPSTSPGTDDGNKLNCCLHPMINSDTVTCPAEASSMDPCSV